MKLSATPAVYTDCITEIAVLWQGRCFVVRCKGYAQNRMRF